jgi:hypothetical protein
MSAPLESVWNHVQEQLRLRVIGMLGAHASLADDVLQNLFQYAWKRIETLPTDPQHLERWLMVTARSRAIDVLRKIDPSIPLHADEDDEPHPRIEPTARPEHLGMSPETEQAVREGFARIREHEGITPRDWTIYYLFQLRHLTEHTPEMTAKEVMAHFNSDPRYEPFQRISRPAEVNFVSSQVQNALNAQLALASSTMTETSYRTLGLIVRDFIASRYHKGPQEHQS